MSFVSYHHARSGSHGRMICESCRKPITEGFYRVKDKPDRYIVWHRACTANDPQWAKQDAALAEAEAKHQAYVAACREFVARWGVPDIEDFEF